MKVTNPQLKITTTVTRLIQHQTALKCRIKIYSLNATESDHGHYLCHADNGVGIPLSKVIMLTVHSKSVENFVVFTT
jgi:hypothetical protein